MSRIVVSGIGIVAAAGCDASEFWTALTTGEDCFSASPTHPEQAIPVGAIRNPEIRAQVAAASVRDPSATFAVIAAARALADAGLSNPFARPERVGVILGNGAGGMCSMDEQFVRMYRDQRRVHPMTVPKAMVSSSASWVSMTTGAKGPCFVTSSACASASHAVGIGASLLKSGLCDVAIVGGTEAPLSHGTVTAWDAMKIMSRTRCRPFAAGRDGLILAEGAGVLVLETEAHAQARGHHATIELAGFGFSADAGDIVAPDVAGMSSAMRSALDSAALSPHDVDYINAHGTGTKSNDRIETQAIKAVFNGRCPAISSTKSVTGHALGAAGAFEAVATILAMTHDTAPPTMNFDGADPDCDLDYVPNHSRAMPINIALSNSFAFGGLNASLVFRKI